MIDKATLIKLTKEDLLLLWQAAETEWVRKLGKIKNQRDTLLLHLRRSGRNRNSAARSICDGGPTATSASTLLRRSGNWNWPVFFLTEGRFLI